MTRCLFFIVIYYVFSFDKDFKGAFNLLYAGV